MVVHVACVAFCWVNACTAKKRTLPMPKKGNPAAAEGEEVPSKQRKTGPSAVPTPLNFTSPSSLFQSLIAPLGLQEFFQEYWEKKPLFLQRSDPGLATYYQSLFQLSDLKALCGQGIVYDRDVVLCRCVNGKKNVLSKQGRVNYSQLKKDFEQKKVTLQFHQPQRFKVFILQLEGEKHWRLYEPTVPLAQEYSLEPEERIGSPTHDITLKAGDLLYFPRGTIHQADTPVGVDHSTHLTISTYQKMSWGDFLLDVFPSFLFDSMRSDITLRAGLPRKLLTVASPPPGTTKQLCSFMRDLADKMERGQLEPHSVGMKRDFVSNRLPPYVQDDLAFTPAGKMPALEDLVSMKFVDHILVTVEPSEEITDEAVELVVFLLHSLANSREDHMMGNDAEEEQKHGSRGLRFALSHLPALRQLQSGERHLVANLQLDQDADKLNLALSLWSEGLLMVC
ncbi:ribosomal oxygenase 2 isoform X3 [Conger conger]|uniref:ribosomal oxygenase 2 isoform X3 n=1 Tax=Conger conger TaxID=82655 RepID=UPI002A5AAD9A|nr:ribosomal oxygenase 2 isoform X3 [Conger conger]